jgi:hypothetical protein
VDEPPVEQWRRETIAAEQAAAAAATTVEPVTVDSAIVEPVVVEPESTPGDVAPDDDVVATTIADADPADVHAPELDPTEPAPPEPDAGQEGAPTELPLPTRVPGANLSHTPASTEGEPVDESDPMRPYRVHELLTRHSQGVTRGHTHEPPGGADPVARGDAAPFEPEDLR